MVQPTTQTIESYKKFDDLTYYYIAICLTLVLMMLVSNLYLVRSFTKPDKLKFHRIAKKTMIALWSVYETVISQNVFDPYPWSMLFVLLFLVMVTFRATMGVLLNLMSTEQDARIAAPRINSLEVFLTSRFAHHQANVSKSLCTYVESKVSELVKNKRRMTELKKRANVRKKEIFSLRNEVDGLKEEMDTRRQDIDDQVDERQKKMHEKNRQ